MREELRSLDSGIHDTKMKLGTMQKLDEALLTQITTPIYKIDPHYNENRNRLVKILIRLVKI